MIALQYGLPLVRSLNGSTTFDTHQLRLALTSAAARAGYHGWWLADDLVEGIAHFLRHHYDSSVIDLSRLENGVRALLCDVGYREVALRFHSVSPEHGAWSSVS